MKGIMIRTTGFQGRWSTHRGTVVCFCPGPELSLRSADGGSLLCTDTAPGALKTSARLTNSSLQLYGPGAAVHRCRNKGIKKSAGCPRPQSEQEAKPARQPWRWLGTTTARSFSPRSPAQGHPTQRTQVCLVSKACRDRWPACYFWGHTFCLWTPRHAPRAWSALRIHLLSDFRPSDPNTWACLWLALNRTLGNLGRADVKTLTLSVPSAGAKSRTAPLSLTKVG